MSNFFKHKLKAHKNHINILIYTFLIITNIITSSFFIFNKTSGDNAALTGLPLDDNWIHFVYAKNLAEEWGFNYNPGVPEAGFTSPLWIIILAIPFKILLTVLGPVTISKILSITLAIATSILTFKITYMITQNHMPSM